MQYHTPASFELKDDKLHDLYEKKRVIQDTSSAEYLAWDDEMLELSDSLEIPKT